MTKIEQVEKAILKARLEKNSVAKNALQTLKGEYELESKKPNGDGGDVLFEKLAKKAIKNATIVGNDEALQEIEIIKTFLPEELSEDKLTEIILNVFKASPEKLADLKAGNKSLIGFFMGSVMKETRNQADGKVVGKLLNKLLNG